jgi:transcriptional regulatory protein LevR
MTSLDARLEDRLALLERSSQVDADVAAFLGPALSELADRFELEANDETFGSLCTHTALALQRARNQQAISSWDTDHTDELRDHPAQVDAAERFASRAEAELGLTLPAQERDFIALHLASVSLRVE